MNILVIGNGVDLAHGLPTRYWDFLTFAKAIKKLDLDSWGEEITEFENRLDALRINVDTKKYILNNVFSKNNRSKIINELMMVKENIWIDYFLKYCYEKCKHKGWIDFETEISNIIKNLDRAKQNRSKNRALKLNDAENKVESFINEYIKAHGKLPSMIRDFNNEDYTDNIIEVLEKSLDELIRSLEIYLIEIVEKIDIKIRVPEIESLNIGKVLSFNYTSTYKRLYESNDKSIEYDYIHGKAENDRNIEDNNMVVGIDEYLDENRKNSDVEFIKFKKYFQRIHKQTGSQYKEWLSHIKNTRSINVNHIYFFGHSLDVTDKDILNELIKCKNVVITIFYLNKKVYAQQIANLVKVIGCDELIERVSKPNPKIIFEQQESIS